MATNLNRGITLWRKLRQNSVVELGRMVTKNNFSAFSAKVKELRDDYSDQDTKDLYQSYFAAFPPAAPKSPSTPLEQQNQQGSGGFSRDSGYRGEDPLVTVDEQRQKDELQEKLNTLKAAEEVLQDVHADQGKKTKARELKEKTLEDIVNSLDAKNLLEDQHDEFEKGIQNLKDLSDKINANQITKEELVELGIENPEQFQKDLKTFTEASTTKSNVPTEELKNQQIAKISDPKVSEQLFSKDELRKRIFSSGKIGEDFEKEIQGLLTHQQDGLRTFHYERLNNKQIPLSIRTALVRRRNLITLASGKIKEIVPEQIFRYRGILTRAYGIVGWVNVGAKLVRGDFGGATRDAGQTIAGYGVNRLATNVFGRLLGFGGGAAAGEATTGAGAVAGGAGAAEAVGGVAAGVGAVAAAPEVGAGIGAGAIIAIVVGIILFLLLCFFILFIILFKQGIGNGGPSGATLGVQRTIELTQKLITCEQNQETSVDSGVVSTVYSYHRPSPDCIRHLQLSGPPDAARAALDNLADGASGILQCGVFIYSAVDYAQWPAFPGAHTVEDWFVNFVLPNIFPGLGQTIQVITKTISGYEFITNNGQTSGPNAILPGDIIIYGPGQPGHISFVTKVEDDHFHFTVAEANFQSGVAKFRTTELDHHIGSETILGWWRKKL